jgi:hypothetical protein
MRRTGVGVVGMVGEGRRLGIAAFGFVSHMPRAYGPHGLTLKRQRAVAEQHASKHMLGPCIA